MMESMNLVYEIVLALDLTSSLNCSMAGNLDPIVQPGVKFKLAINLASDFVKLLI